MSHPLKHRRSIRYVALYLIAMTLFTYMPQSAKPILLLGLAAVGAAFFLFRRKKGMLACFYAALLIAAALIPSYLYDVTDDALVELENTQTVTVTVINVSYEKDGFAYATGCVTDVDGAYVRADVRLTVIGTAVKRGDILEGRATLSPIEENASYQRSLGIRHQLSMTAPSVVGRSHVPRVVAKGISESLCSCIKERVPGEEGALLCALLLGERSGLPDSFVRDMSRTGTSHMLALSGLHLSILLLGLDRFLMFLTVHKRVRYGILVFLTLGYMALIGFTHSAMRAGIMLLFMLFTFFIKGSYDGITSLAFSVALILTIEPYATESIGLWLSAFSTLGILLILDRELARGEGELPKSIFQRLRQYALTSVKMTLAASIATLPIICFTFGSISVLSVIANLLFAPLMPTLIFLALTVLIAGWISPVNTVAAFVADLLIDGAALLSGIPNTQLPLSHPLTAIAVCLGSLLLFLYVALWDDRHFRFRVPLALILTGSLLLLSVRGGALLLQRGTATVFYTGDSYGDSILIKEGTETTVIDCASSTKKHFDTLFSSLLEMGETEIDHYVLAAYNARIDESALYLLENYVVHSLYLPIPKSFEEEALFDAVYTAAKAEGSALSYYAEGEPLTLGKISYTTVYRSKLSEEKRLYFTVSYEDERLDYLSRGLLDEESIRFFQRELAASDGVILGSYGIRPSLALSDADALTDAPTYALSTDALPFISTDGVRVQEAHRIRLKRQ